MHVPPPNLSSGTLLLSRRSFLGSCSVLALCLSGCQSAAPRARFAAYMLADPPEREYRPVLRALVRAILPFEHPRFPAIVPEHVEARLLDLFPVDTAEQFSPLQRGLLFFNDLDLFPDLHGPLLRAETAGDSGAERLSGDRLARLRHEEQGRFARFRASTSGSAARFTELPIGEQRLYLRMWSASGLTAKRQFARSAKTLVMVTAYSMEEMWRAIGYEGPLLESVHAAS